MQLLEGQKTTFLPHSSFSIIFKLVTNQTKFIQSVSLLASIKNLVLHTKSNMIINIRGNSMLASKLRSPNKHALLIWTIHLDNHRFYAQCMISQPTRENTIFPQKYLNQRWRLYLKSIKTLDCPMRK